MTPSLPGRIDTVFLPVRELVPAAAWYARVLGWPQLWRNDGIVVLGVEGATPLTLVRHRYPGLPDAPADEPFRPLAHVAFNFHAADLGGAHRRLRELGVEVGPIVDHGPVQEFRFRDPDGNPLSMVHC